MADGSDDSTRIGTWPRSFGSAAANLRAAAPDAGNMRIKEANGKRNFIKEQIRKWKLAAIGAIQTFPPDLNKTVKLLVI